MGELALAVAVLDPGPRRDRLDAAITAILDADFAGRVLPYDRGAAAIYGTRIAAARRHGVSVGQGDAQIAAIALTSAAPVATRDRLPFEALGVEVIDPWRFEGQNDVCLTGV
ncbi:VapC toxin family PIN domain ribonuclease [uncultured Jannaschia sp.]|uniref:VapC toxin family PIN domain ribonuclease n=1 Tax=uncultured Jannaschia sp. TaxID=293347 RepID=UPI002626B13A|nr:VapC toxin family PIN domain ribonuclease [uncultured Jannaschia sp.]